MKKKILILSIGIFIILGLTLISANQCNDGIDNDLDGKIDYPNDDGCISNIDRTESKKLGYANACLSKGDKLEDVFGKITYTCGSTSCFTCVLMTEAGNYSTIFSRCRNLPRCGFSDSGGNMQIDVTPPELIINSPTQLNIYDSRKVLFDIIINEPVYLEYKDEINGRGKWKRLGNNIKTYYRSLRFKEGLNNVTIKAIDKNENEVIVSRQFYVDSKDPRIRRAYPKKGFANGIFEVEFEESNPEKLILNYGNTFTGFRMDEVNLDNCNEYRSKTNCLVEVSLDDFDGEFISYWFSLTDIAGNTDDSKKINLEVDNSNPSLLNQNSFWFQGSERKNRYIYFDIIIDEDNFDDITYIDNEDRRPRERRICSRLKDGRCIKRVSFRKGFHSIDVQITDKAGNAISERIEFEVV